MKNVEGRRVVRAVGELLWMNAAMFHAMGMEGNKSSNMGGGDCKMM